MSSAGVRAVKRVACWKSKDAYAVVNPDADALEDFIFRAVHTDLPVQISTGRAGGSRNISPEAFMREVLEPKDHLLVPVIGDSGTANPISFAG